MAIDYDFEHEGFTRMDDDHLFPRAWSRAVVRFTSPGFHHWNGATGEREYLASPHRHLFFVEVSVEVSHDDREIEFHDLLDWCRSEFGSGDFGGQSCEMLARGLLEKIVRRFGKRRTIVSVFEDNEVGAVVSTV